MKWPTQNAVPKESKRERERASVRLTGGCIVTGKPAPSIGWYRNGRPLSNESIRDQRDGVVRAEVALKNLGRKDVQTELSCNATNNNRSQPLSSSVRLDMHCKYTRKYIYIFLSPATHVYTHYYSTLDRNIAESDGTAGSRFPSPHPSGSRSVAFSEALCVFFSVSTRYMAEVAHTRASFYRRFISIVDCFFVLYIYKQTGKRGSVLLGSARVTDGCFHWFFFFFIPVNMRFYLEFRMQSAFSTTDNKRFSAAQRSASSRDASGYCFFANHGALSRASLERWMRSG